MKVTKGTQRPNQTKEQTKLISQGIEKGIVEFKKQQNKKARDRDKARKAKLTISVDKYKPEITEVTNSGINRLPWALLIISWIGFASWYLYN